MSGYCFFKDPPFRRVYVDATNINSLILFSITDKGPVCIAVIDISRFDKDIYKIVMDPQFGPYPECFFEHMGARIKYANNIEHHSVSGPCNCDKTFNPNIRIDMNFKENKLHYLQLNYVGIMQRKYRGPPLGINLSTDNIVEEVRAKILTDKFIKEIRASLLTDVIDMLMARDEEFKTDDARKVIALTSPGI
ncbi:MAG: hypothetical protein ACYC3F_16670 [Gemmatimonadaceae bacterium]